MASFCGLLVLLACVSVGFGEDSIKQPSCSKVKIAYRSKRFSESDVPVTARDGGDLRVCPRNSGLQCCSQKMEERFAALARTDFEKAVNDRVSAIKALFNEQAKVFDAFVQQLIKKAQGDLNSMFKKIYGSHYVLNEKLFMDLFVDFISYYNDGESDLLKVMDKFFSDLMRRMFQIINKDNQYTSSYLDCMTRHMKELTPFGDIPEKLVPQVKKTLVQARTFSQALHLGRDIVDSLGRAISSSGDCIDQLVELKYCSWCKDLTSLKPCHKFCTDVHQKCLADIAQVNYQWQNFLNALSDLVGKQTGPTNIQDVIGPINLKISFAIMNFQSADKQKEVKEKSADGCGTPGGVNKRSTDDFFIEGNNRQRRDNHPATLARSSLSSQQNLDKLATTYKAKMRVGHNFWTNLPYSVCDQISNRNQNLGCWNGVSNGSYTSPDDGNDLQGGASLSVQKAIERLKGMVDQLKAAMEGEEVNMIDDEDDGSSGSGSASGDGSSDGENLIPDDTDQPPTRSINEIDDEEQGGGVGKPSSRPRSSASQHTLVSWLICSVVLSILIG